MQTKLTLRRDSHLIRHAKRYAARSGKSVSTVVADYFTALDAPPDDSGALPPRVRALLGALADTDLDEAASRSYLESKHR